MTDAHLLPDEAHLGKLEANATRGEWKHEEYRYPLNEKGREHYIKGGNEPRDTVVHMVQTAWNHPQLQGPVPITGVAEHVRPDFFDTAPKMLSGHMMSPHVREDDAAFIATARNLVPVLLDRLATLRTAADADRRATEALRAENARLKEAIKTMAGSEG